MMIKIKDNNGNRSRIKLKKRNSAIKKIDPGKPKNIKEFVNIIKNNLGVRKFSPLISVIKRVLNLLLMASTRRNEFVDKNA